MAVNRYIGLLGRSEVFACLSEEALRPLAEAASLVSLDRGGCLFAKGDAGDAAYLVVSGELEISVLGRQGKEAWLTSAGPGALVGEMSLLDGEPRSADVTAARRTEVLRLSRRTFLEALSGEPSAAIALLRTLTRRLRDLDERYDEAKSLTLPSRLAQFLLDQSGSTITFSQSDMGRVLGASRETVNRHLSEWRRRGWISSDSRGIRVADPASLERLVGPRD